MADIKLEAELSMDTSQGEAAVNKFGQSFNKMARETEQEAKRAKDAIKEIPTAFQAEKIDRDTRTIAASIKRTTTQMELLGKTASQKFELKIESKGLDKAQFEPALQKMREIEAQAARSGVAASGSLEKIGVSAGQTRMALAQLPMQFSDIFVSLQGGQKPMTVFLQQGAQIKDSFGGAGAAVKAMGGYVLGLINPFTIAAAGIGVFGLAMAKANSAMSESNGIAVRLEATGRSADITREQFSSLTKELALLPGVSKDASKAILGEFLKTREIGGGLFRELGMSVADFAAATGVTAPEAAKTLAKAFADPVKGAKELEDALGSLTSGQLLTIEALEKVGDKAGSQRILMDALKASVNGMANEALTPLGRAVDDLGNAWGGMLGKVGNSSALNTANNIFAAMIGNVAALARNLSSMKLPPWLEKQFSGGLNGLVFDALGGKGEQKGVTGSWAAPVDKVDDEVKNVLNLTSGYRSQASAMSYVKAQGDLLRKSLEALRGEGKGNSVQAKELEDRLTGVSEKLASMGKKAGGGAAATAAKRELSEYDKLIASIKTKILQNEAEVAGNGKLNESEKLRLSLVTQIEQGTRKMTAAHLESAQAQLKQLDASEQAKAVYLAQQKFEVEHGKEIVSRNNGILKIEESAQALEDEVAMYGKGKEAIEALSIARLEEKKAILLQFDGSDQRIQQIEDEIAARKRLAVAGDGMAALKMGTHTDQLLANAKEQASLYEDELKLTGLTSLERAKVVAQRQVEIKYAKELAKIDASQLSDGAKEVERQKVNEARQIEGSAAVNKAIQDDWAKTADQINQSLTDALMRGFESGKGFGQSLRDSLVNTFKTMVLRPVISAIVSPVSGAVNGVVGAGMNAVGLGGSGMSGLSAISSAGSLYNMGATTVGGLSSGATTVGGILTATGAEVATAATYGTAVGSAQTAMLTAQTAGMTTGAAGGATAALGAVPVYGWIALAALAAYAIFSGDKDPASQSTGDTRANYDKNGNKTSSDNRFGFESAQTTSLTDALQKSYAGMAASLGIGTVDSNFGVGGNSDGKVAHFGIGSNAGGVNYTSADNIEYSEEKYQLEASRAVISALKGSELPRYLTGVFDGLTASTATQEQINQVLAYAQALKQFDETLKVMPFDNLREQSYGAVQGLIAASGGLEQLQTNLGFYFENFYGAGEKAASGMASLTAQFDLLGLSVPANEAQLRDLIAAQDISTAAGQNMAASLLGLAPAFYNVAEAARASAQQMMSVMSSYASAGEQRQYQLEQIQKGLADGGVNVSTGQLGSTSRDQAWQFYKDAVAANDTRTADAIFSQLDAFAKVTDAAQSVVFGSGVGSSGGGGGSSGSSAAASIANAWQAITDSIWGEVKRIRGLLEGSGQDAFAAAQARFTVATAQARAGDQDAAKALPELSQAILALADTNVGTLLELKRIQGQTAASLSETNAGISRKYGTTIPSFDVGTNYVPRDMLAMIHEGEAIIPRAYNPTANGGGNSNAETANALRRMADRLDAIEANTRAGAQHGGKTARLIERVMPDGDAVQMRETPKLGVPA